MRITGSFTAGIFCSLRRSSAAASARATVSVFKTATKSVLKNRPKNRYTFCFRPHFISGEASSQDKPWSTESLSVCIKGSLPRASFPAFRRSYAAASSRASLQPFGGHERQLRREHLCSLSALICGSFAASIFCSFPARITGSFGASIFCSLSARLCGGFAASIFPAFRLRLSAASTRASFGLAARIISRFDAGGAKEGRIATESCRLVHQQLL